MKKFYSLLAVAFCSMSAMAQVSVDNLAGKYVLEGDEPVYYIEDHGFQNDNIVLLERTGNNTFSLDNFYYDMSDYDGNRIKLNGTFQDLGEWASYPTVQDIQFQYDATNVFFYNPYAETEDTEWFFPYYNSFRLLTQLDENGTPNLYLWPNNSILLTYYTAADENWSNPALEFVNKGAWNAETNPVGSLHLKRLPQYQTVTKRGIVGEYTVKGKDDDGNEVSYKVSIDLDGTDYIMTGLFGSDAPSLTFVWDDTDAGIHAYPAYTWDEEGNATSFLESYAPNTGIYISFTEDGNLAFDHALYYGDGENDYYLYDAIATKAGEDDTDLAQFAGKYIFTGTNPWCNDAAYTPAANYECEITVEGDELHMNGFLGQVDNEGQSPYYKGTYNEVLGTVYFECGGTSDGGFVVDGDTWYYVYDVTLNVGKNDAGHITLSRDGSWLFYAYGDDWITAGYDALFFEKDGELPSGINDVNANANGNNTCYNIAGQRVNSTAKGIIIKNGKKYINK